jgi:hypothetical protein
VNQEIAIDRRAPAHEIVWCESEIFSRAEPSFSTCNRARHSRRSITVAIEENAVTKIISRRAMLTAVLAACTVSFAASPAHIPNAQQLVRPGQTDRADGIPRRRTAAPQTPMHQDPFADLLLG